MGLFLSMQRMWDMPLGGTSDEKQIPHWFGNLAFAVVGVICKVLFRYRVYGRENIREFYNKSGALVVSTHTSYLDVAFIYLAARPKQWVRLIGKDSLFLEAHGLLGQILSRVGAIPIKRDTADRKAIKRATKMLKNNELVGIFPEGTRRGKSNIEPKLHSGAAFIAKMGKAPIVPMTVRNAELVKQKGKLIHFPTITVHYGNPILVSDFDDLPKDERLDACTWYTMRECFSLFYQIPPERVDMATLFPDTKDYTAYFAENPVSRHTPQEIIDTQDEATQPEA